MHASTRGLAPGIRPAGAPLASPQRAVFDGLSLTDHAVGSDCRRSASAPALSSPHSSPLSRGSPTGYVDARGWSAAEDGHLVKQVRQFGIGNWGAKAAKFITKRTASAIRKRWSVPTQARLRLRLR